MGPTSGSRTGPNVASQRAGLPAELDERQPMVDVVAMSDRRPDMHDQHLFELLSDTVPEADRAAYRALWESLPPQERRPCPSCFSSLKKYVPLRELGEENRFDRWRCTGCFVMFYKPVESGPSI